MSDGKSRGSHWDAQILEGERTLSKSRDPLKFFFSMAYVDFIAGGQFGGGWGGTGVLGVGLVIWFN